MKLPTLDTDWYVLRCPARSEYRAADELRQGGYHAYVPTYKVLRRAGRYRLPIIPVARPLLAGYLFLSNSKPIQWGEILHNDLHYRHCGKPLTGSLGPLLVPASLVVQIHVEEVEGLYDEKMPKAKDRRRNRIRDLKELFNAMEATRADIAA